jgi:hypothetical protein
MVLSLVSLAFESDNFDYLSPNPSSLSKIGKFWVQYRLEVQVTGELRIFLDDLSHESQSLNFSLRSLLMGLRNCNIVINTLGKSISQVPSPFLIFIIVKITYSYFPFAFFWSSTN